MRRFLGDRTRNRASAGKLEVSSIFKWFREDFEKGHQGFRKLEDVFARYAAQLSDEPAVQEQLKAAEAGARVPGLRLVTQRRGSLSGLVESNSAKGT